MYFLLDKDYAIQNIARCIGISKEPFTEKEIENYKNIYNAKETIIFVGDDIPHKFKYNKELDIIEELIEVEEVVPRMLSEEIQEVESDFDESVEIDPEKQYFYLDKAYADKFHKSQVIAVFPKPLKNPTEYFQKEVYQHFGKDIPFYISIDDTVVREATEYEKYQRGQRKLQDREVAFNNEIIYLEEGWYIEGEELIKVPKPKGVNLEFNEETHKWVELATPEEIKNYIGKYVGDGLLMQVLAKGCEVEIAGEKHIQVLDSRKLIILSSTGTGVLISQNARQEVNTIPWSFNDDGSDSTILTLEQFSELAIQCLDYAMKCYTVADILKAQDRLDITLDEFLEELKNFENLQPAMMSLSAKTPSNLYLIQQTINKYNKLNNVLDCEDMKDSGVFTDYRTYMKELFECEVKLKKDISSLVEIPVASEKLQTYFKKLEEQRR